MTDRDATAAQQPSHATSGFPRDVVLVNIADERDNARFLLDFPPIPGMYMDVPWSDVLHCVDYILLDGPTRTLKLGMVPMEPW